MKAIRDVLLVLCVATFCATPTVVLAQPPLTTAVENTEPPVTTEPVDTELKKRLSSPRGTFQTLIESVESGDLELASKCLDLSELAGFGEAKQQTGREYARKLKTDILDRMMRIDLSRIPGENDPNLESLDRFLLAEISDGAEDQQLPTSLRSMWSRVRTGLAF